MHSKRTQITWQKNEENVHVCTFSYHLKSDHIDMLKNQGYKIIFDPSGDGSCQFSAIAYFFCSSGFDCSEEVVDYLKTHRKNVCSQKSYQLIHNQRILCFEKSEKIHFMV